VAARTESLGRAQRYARRESRDVINLARLQPSEDLLPHELMARCLERVMSEHGARALTYAPPEGVHRLREEIAKDLMDRGVPATAEDILVTTGSQQALDLIARALVNPGDTVLVDETTYSGAIDLLTLAGARLVSVPSDGQGPDLAALQRFARPDVKALYLMPNGHNPTGLSISAERRRALVAWSQASGIALIEDDYAAGLVLEEGEQAPSLRALDGDVIHLSSFSKRLIPALRVGFIVCPHALRTPLTAMKRVMDLGVSAMLQHALAEFMERGYLRAHMHRIIPEYRLRRDTLERALLAALPDSMRFQRPSHGVVLWLPLPSGMDADVLYEEALRQGVLLSPNAMWSVDGRAQPGVRLTFCAETAPRIAEGARRLGKAIKALARSPAAARRRTESPVIEAV
jgi:DNA-binding transcriptional MocR family regulator